MNAGGAGGKWLGDAPGRASIALAALIVSTRTVGASNQTPWMQPQSDHPSPVGPARLRSRARQLLGVGSPALAHRRLGRLALGLEDEYGIFLFGNYTAEVAGNPVGGITQGVKYTHNIGLAFLVDLDTLAGIDAHDLHRLGVEPRRGPASRRRTSATSTPSSRSTAARPRGWCMLALGTELLRRHAATSWRDV